MVLENNPEYSEKNFSFSKTFLLSKNVKIRIVSRHKNIPNPKAKIIGIISARFHVEKRSKNILHQKVQGANQEINQSKREPLISFLFFPHVSEFEGYFIFLYDFLIK